MSRSQVLASLFHCFNIWDCSVSKGEEERSQQIRLTSLMLQNADIHIMTLYPHCSSLPGLFPELIYTAS